MVVDAHGNTNRFEFRDVVRNGSLPVGVFRARPPRGTRIIKP
jgi:outer membrane lipoprotein-sorting protein